MCFERLDQRTLEEGELEVVVVQRQVVLHGRQAARPGGQITDTLVFTVQHLSEVICNTKDEDLHYRTGCRASSCAV